MNTCPQNWPRRARLELGLVVVALWVLGPVAPAAETGPERNGAKVYRQMCARCHGASGEGSEDVPQALAGNRSVPQLVRYIAKEMPEDDPGTCTGDDASKVSEYIHDAFYSRAAQERNTPPRIELSRLTVRQYRHALADLFGSFRATAVWGTERGLMAEYSKGRGRGGDKKVITRVDPEVKFDFGFGSPDAEKLDPESFSIRWEGSVFAPESGEYTFVVRTEHATRLFVNDLRTPLIDAMVKSGNDTEYHGSLVLLGGRAYPLRLEFAKGKRGVDDSEKKKKKEKPPEVNASVVLEWMPPHRAAEVVPSRCLSPVSFAESYVVTAPFPPDDRSVGYERGSSVSKAWDQATTEAALEAAAYVDARRRELTGAGNDASPADREAKYEAFVGTFAERAFRRPLGDETKGLYVGHPFAGAKNLDVALKQAVLLVLKSPRFLYREVGGGPQPDGYDVASRLAFGLWDSIPDAPLREAAASGKLGSKEEVAAQAARMLEDVRARAKLREFFLIWLKVDQFPEISKDPVLYPGFDSSVASDLRTSLDLFLEGVVGNEPSDYRQLLLADSVHLNGRLAKLYGVDMPADAPFRKVKLDDGRRAGVLTHPYLLSTFSYTSSSSPIHRGVFVARSLLGRGLKTPPIAVAPLAPDLHAGLTTRERVTLQTSPTACQSCHAMINPLGFGLEQFDAIGRFRELEKDKSVDASGVYESPEGEARPYSGARPLATLVAESGEGHTAFVEQLFHHLVKQPVRAYGARVRADLTRSFEAHDYSIRKLAVEIVTSTSLAPREAKPPEVAVAAP